MGIFASTCILDNAVVLVLKEGTRWFSQSLHIPNSVQIDDGLKRGVEKVWEQIQWMDASYAQSLVVGLQHISTFF